MTRTLARFGFALVATVPVAVVVLVGTPAGPLGAQSPKRGHPAQHRDMQLLGHDALQARSAYQPVIHAQGRRWIAYVGHHGGSALNPLTGVVENNGTSIVDVTDPRRPRYLFHLPGPSGAGGAQMVRVCNGRDLPRGDAARVYMLRTFGNDGHQVHDVTIPEAPAPVVDVITGLNGAHKSWWECDTGIAYLVSDGHPEGWRTSRMTKIYDLSNPARPVFIRNFGLVGQEPGSTGPVPTGLHGPIAHGNRVYFGHGTGANGILQIVDRDRLLGDPSLTAATRVAPTPEQLLYPQVGRLDTAPTGGAHTTFPVQGIPIADFAKDAVGSVRDFVVLVNESVANECREPRQLVYLVDVTTDSRPFPVSNFQVPESSGSFCTRGGRFGAHSSNENMTPIYYRKLVFIAYFNAGVRAVDIRDPFNPREAAHYIPATTANTDERCVTVGGVERCKIAIQTNNVEVDDRGLIYATDRARTGLHILQLTGAARQIVAP